MKKVRMKYSYLKQFIPLERESFKTFAAYIDHVWEVLDCDCYLCRFTPMINIQGNSGSYHVNPDNYEETTDNLTPRSALPLFECY